jgi:hypothetical protein
MGTGQTIITAGGLAFAATIIIVWLAGFVIDVPDTVAQALTAILTAAFVYVAPFLPKRQAA